MAAATNAPTRVGQPDTLHHLALAKSWHIGEVLGAELGRWQGKATHVMVEVKGIKTQGTCLRETSLEEMELGMVTDWRLGAWDSKVEELFLRKLARQDLNSTEAVREVT